MHQKSHRRNMHTSYDRQWNGGQRHIGKMSVDNVLQQRSALADKPARCARSMHRGKRQNLKTVMWPFMGWYVILLVTLDVVYMYKTFDDSSVSYSRDMKWSQPLAAAPGYIISDRRISFHSIADSERERIPKKVQLWPEWRGHTEKMRNHYREPERIESVKNVTGFSARRQITCDTCGKLHLEQKEEDRQMLQHCPGIVPLRV